jgi:heme exporter protein C
MRIFSSQITKIITVLLMLYTLIGGFLMPVPRIPIINETIRNQYFHVSMWFAMMIVLAISVYHAVKYLANGKSRHDIISVETANAGILLGVLGLITGSIWAKFTWGAYWSGDPKQNGAAIALLIYLAYFVLRGSLTDAQQKGRISAIYNIFAFSTRS